MSEHRWRAALVVDEPYQRNRIFDAANRALNRDNCLAPMRALRRELALAGIDLATSDLNPVPNSDFAIYFEAPRRPPPRAERDRSYLLAMEHPLIRPANDAPDNPAHYRRIFTWNDRRIDGEHYIKLNFSAEVPEVIPADCATRPRLAVAISANKQLAHPQELYSHRIRTVRWFEANHPGELDLYGFGWGEHCFTGVFRVLNRSPWLRRHWPREPYPSWRGAVEDKLATMAAYRFCICYENVRDSPGWITEKIFDALFAGCIPVYRGADNIADYLPPGCFIDERDFDSLEALYEHMRGFTAADYRACTEAVASFVRSPAMQPFTADHFARTIAGAIQRDL